MDDELYRELIIEHYRNPLHTGRMDGPDLNAKGHNPTCGDETEIFLRIKDGKVEEAVHDSKGCAISMAAVSMLTDTIRGKTLEELSALRKEDVLDMLGVPVGTMRLRCALLSLETLRKALKTNV